LEIAELLDPDLVICNLKARDAEKVIRHLGGLLYEKGLVKGTFVEATLAREKEMPTGLPIGEINAAIPHADIEHVIEPALALATLHEFVSFQVMVNPEESVKVSIVFLLALNKPHDQIEMLQKVAMVLQDSALLRDLKRAKSSKEMVEILSKT
jgi:PTS system galactitol-specific IIA component